MNGQAVIIGASGGIGDALTRLLLASERFERVHALSRNGVAIEGAVAGHIDLASEASIEAASVAIGPEVDCLIVASGWLHGPRVTPERALRELDAAQLMQSFAVNSIGPALVLKYFTPLLPKERKAMIGILSARVGSISDNHLGGWYGYRASKAALNMIVKCAAIELHRTRPQTICVGLHPGTVDTPLSKPFQRGVPDDKLFAAEYSAARLMQVLDGLSPPDSGLCYAWDGAVITP